MSRKIVNMPGAAENAPEQAATPERSQSPARAHAQSHAKGTAAHNHGQDHDHDHAHSQRHETSSAQAAEVVVIRPASGLSGDMLLTGLARLSGASNEDLQALAASLSLPEGCVAVERREISSVNGWGCRVTLPTEHSHRTLGDIRVIIDDSDLTPQAKRYAVDVFVLLAQAEGEIHGVAPEQVTFHEVGALDSILDICLCCALYDRMDAPRLVCGSLPLCDGVVRCAHGLLPTPAPAVLALLEGVPVHGIDSRGETVTPTAIALLKGLKAEFGGWPEMTIAERALVYGGRVLPNVCNGTIFARGALPTRS